MTCRDIALKRSTREKFEIGQSCCWSSTSSNSKHYTAELVIYKANISITSAAKPKMHISIVVFQFRNTHPTALVSYSANLYDSCATINQTDSTLVPKESLYILFQILMKGFESQVSEKSQL